MLKSVRTSGMGCLGFMVAVLAAAPFDARAVGFEEAYEALESVDESFVNTGAICEHVAKLELQKDFPPTRHDVQIGVSYLVDGQVIGELDVVVVERATGRIPVIGEVKCWKNLASGLEKANEQEQRFRETLSAPGLFVNFVKFQGSAAVSMGVDAGDFVPGFDHLSIGQNGARKVGYDRELEMSLEELMDLRKKLMSRKRR